MKIDIISIISIILTIGFGIAGIAVSLHCWRHNYEKQKEHNKLIDKLNAISFVDEYSFAALMGIFKEADSKGIDISGYFNVDKHQYSDGKISKNQVLSTLFNVYQNNKDMFNKSEEKRNDA